MLPTSASAAEPIRTVLGSGTARRIQSTAARAADCTQDLSPHDVVRRVYDAITVSVGRQIRRRAEVSLHTS